MKLLDQLEAMTPRPDAVFAASDEIAMGLLAAAHRAGIRVPEDLKILGFDDGPIAEAMGFHRFANRFARWDDERCRSSRN